MTAVACVEKPAFINDDIEEEINADFSVLARVDTVALDWQKSPASGVLRKRLELVGQETPRLTTIVKFAAGSSFNEHGHDGGEEFLVLSGVFSDASGDYGEGCYVRNPPASMHAPFTEEGCIILVKLRQFLPHDSKQLVVDTSGRGVKWVATGEPGISRLELHHFEQERVALCRILPHCWIDHQRYHQGLEIFVCEGSISDGEGSYSAGTWLRYPAGTSIKIKSIDGARIYMKEGAFPLI